MLLSLLATLPLNAVTKVSLREALEVRTEAATFKLPQGSALEVIKEDDGMLTCEIAGQQFQVAADKTDYQDVIAAKPPAPVTSPPPVTGAPAAAASNNLLDLPGSVFDPNNILFSLSDDSQNGRIVIPKNYEALGDIPISHYQCTLTPKGLVAQMEIVTDLISSSRKDEIFSLIRQKFPVTKDESPSLSDDHKIWLSGNKRINIFPSNTRSANIGFSIRIHRLNNDITYYSPPAFEAAMKKFDLPALQYAITTYEVPAKLAAELWHSPEARVNPVTIGKITALRQRYNYALESAPANSNDHAKAENPDNTAALTLRVFGSDITRNILRIDRIDISQPRAGNFKLPVGQYMNLLPSYIVLNQPCAIPLNQTASKYKHDAYAMVAVVVATKKP
jgi:hypothetical protein